MSDFMIKSSRASDDDKRAKHFYCDGNVTLRVEDKTFRVHKAILSLHSETFKDMFGLCNSQAILAEQDESVTLHDNLQAFTKLLDALYAGVEFICSANVEDCFEVIELAHKYQMPTLECALQQRVTKILPTSAEHAFEINALKPYRNHPSLAISVLRFGPKVLAPWAFYSIGTQLISSINLKDKKTYDPPPTLASINKAFVYSVLILQEAIRNALDLWDSQISEFYASDCSKAVSPTTRRKSPDPACSRYATKFDSDSPLLIQPEEKHGDVIALMARKIKDLEDTMESDNARHNRWCPGCVKSLKSIVSNTLLDLYPILVECVEPGRL